MAIIQSDKSDYSGSEITAIEALQYFKNYENLNFISSIYNSLAISSDATDNHTEAIYWHNEAAESTNDKYSQQLYKNNLATSYLFLKEYSKTITILNDLLKDSIVQQNPDLKSKVIDNLTYAKWKQNPKVNLANEFNNALEIRIENNDDWGQIASHSHLSEYYTDKNHEKSLSHAQKMYQIARELESPDDQLEALQKLISLESPENSKRYAIRYAYLSDSLVTARNRAKDQFAKIRYDSEKNREENQELRIKDTENQLRIQKQRNTNILAFSGIGFLFSALFLLYYWQKSKRKREKLIAAYESEVRISKKVHDVVANDLYRFIIRLQNVLSLHHSEKESLISEAENIYQSSRDISRELHDFDFKNDYNAEIRSLLSSYLSESVQIKFNLLDDEIWESVDDLKKMELFRVLQELMTNMSKHSQANFVLIQFIKEKKSIEIIYRDNGIGLPENESFRKSGIANTENRMESINGAITFESNKGKGLIIKISFPT